MVTVNGPSVSVGWSLNDVGSAFHRNRFKPCRPLGDRQGQHSIRVNDQWRVCFRWTDAGAEDVEFCDYH